MTRLIAFSLATVIGATAQAQTQTPEDPCGAVGLRGLIGQTAEIAEMLVLEQPKRVLAPGAAATMDFRQDRINFLLDQQGLIVRVECG